jgi:hypothetical protein
LNSPPELPQPFAQIEFNFNDYHSDPLEISRTFWFPDITDWWWQQEERHTKLPNLSNVARDISSIIPYCVGVEASFSLGQDVISWRQSKSTGDTLRKEVAVKQFARANIGVLASDNSELDPTSARNNMEMKREVEQKKLHRMAKIHDIWKIWQGSQNLRATQKQSHAQNNIMTAIGYISDTKEIVNTSWSLFQHDGVAAFKLPEKSPVPPALSANDCPGGLTEILNVH